MSRAASLLLAALFGGAVVGGIVWLTRPAPVHVPTPARSTPAAVSPATQTAANPAMATPSGSNASAPPWAGRAGATGASAPTNIGAAISLSPADKNKARQRAALSARIHKLTANGRHPTPAEMSSVLGDMERMEGKSVIAGVDIQALRQNLVNVQKLQRVSQQLQAESQKPGGGDKQKIQDLMAQLKQIQSNMRYDIAKSGPATPVR